MAIPFHKKLLLPIFFFSGFAALIYEVIWTRMLSLVFGSTVEAVSAVVAAFMAGLAVGSYFMGRWADRRENTLLIYSLTELGIGVISLFLYFLILFLPDIYVRLHEVINIETDGALFLAARYTSEFVLVFIPASLMGATFPLMVKAYVSSRNYVGEGMSIIYAVNTLGAVFGAFLTGFFMIPNMGVRHTVYTAFSVNILLAILSLIAAKSSLFTTTVRESKGNIPVRECGPVPLSTLYIPLVLAISGFASLAYQVAWTRVLIMVIGSSVYAFTAILTTFLIGLSVGSFVIARRIEEVRDKVLFLAVLQILLCFSVIGMLPMIDSLPSFFLLLFRLLPTNFADAVFIEFIVAFIVMIVPTLLMGASFPVGARIYIGMVDNIGEGLGRLYSANTIGAIFGSFLTGFVFIPSFGVQKTILFISFLNLYSGAVLLWRADIGRFLKVVIPSLTVALFAYYATTIHTWNKNVLNRGVYVYAEWLKKLPDMGLSLEKFSDEFKLLLFYEEGRGGTVAVTKTDDTLFLQINGKTDAGTSRSDMVTQTMLAALPLLAHRNPLDIAIIGLGSGVSLGAAERFPLRKIDCIEILPEVVKANRYFSSFNHNALNDSRTNLIITDGRQHLSNSRGTYDVIISEPSNPWITGVSNLFTAEYFEIAKKSLREDGIMCQWFHLYAMDTEDLKVLLKTFKSAFPHVSVWAFTPDDLIVLGSRGSARVGADRLRMAFSNAGIRNEFSRIGIGEDSFRGALLMINSEIERFCKNVCINTDDRPVIEFQAPKALYRSTVEKNMEAILSAIKR